MTAGDLTYMALAINPVGGLLVAVPWAVFERNYSVAFIVATAPALAYLQVLVVDLAWSTLARWPAFSAWLDRQRSPKVERLIASGGAFLPVFLLAPLLGPALIMAFMRYTQIPQRRVALPLYTNLVVMTVVLTALCKIVPEWFNT